MSDVPTLAEAGVRGVEPAYAFWGILAPAGTPRPIVERLHGEIVKAIKLPEVNKTLTETLGMDVAALSPEATQRFISEQMARWGKVVKDNDIRVQ
jgi:tripartite-type tricarboxylate transporter receptor subunit TctC